MKVITWNVNGVRARENEVLELIAAERPDVLCLQEIKANIVQLSPALYGLTGLPDYHSIWHGEKGYSGVSVHLRRDRFADAPKHAHPPFDIETRVVEAHAGSQAFISMYVPNGGKDFPAKLSFMEQLASYAGQFGDKELVVCGDFNVTRADIDVHPTQRNPEIIGQLREERELLEAFLRSGHGLIDLARHLNPDDDRMFTWWPYWRQARERNIGWRLDYVCVSPSLAKRVTAMRTLREFGKSDHAPVVATFADA